jgi:hypothetical protein
MPVDIDFIGQLLDHRDPGLHGLHRLSRRHSRSPGDVAGAQGHFLVDDLSRPSQRAQIGGHAHIDHDHSRAGQPRQGVDSRHACHEAIHHLRRNFLGILAHPFGCHAMIAGHGDDRFAGHRRLQ